MKKPYLFCSFFYCLGLAMAGPGCEENKNTPEEVQQETVAPPNTPPDTLVDHPGVAVPDMPFTPDSLLAFARTLQGIPYLYASTDPAKGLDCSGFVTYVFNHFGVTVPRSSVDFTNYGKEIDTSLAMPGDIILFTGTDSSSRVVGHMGFIESRKEGTLYFIHSTSGRDNLGVVITPFENYYRKRFVKAIRVFPDHYFE